MEELEISGICYRKQEALVLEIEDRGKCPLLHSPG